MDKEEYDKLSKEIVDACLTVHKLMGPGLLESVYEWTSDEKWNKTICK